MTISRIAVATGALVIGSTISLFAQDAPKPQPIGMLLAAGDISTCGNNEVWKKYADAVAGLIREEIKQAEAATPKLPYRILALGDLAYDRGTGDQFKCFGERWTFDDVVQSIPKNEAMLPVPGNHEYKTLDARPYFDHFSNNPSVNQDNRKLKGYFAVNFPRTDGPWRLIGLNDNFESAKQYENDKTELKAQTAWLEKDLTDNRQNCVLAFWHAPTFSSGRHGHGYKTAKDAPRSNERAMKKTFGILYRHGASVVLNGHEHNFEQFRKQDETGKAVDDGIRLFVVGTGGSLLTEDVYTHKEDNSEGGAYGLTRGTQGVLKIMLYEKRYEWEFLPIEKEVTKKIGKKTMTTMEKKKLDLATTSADCNTRK